MIINQQSSEDFRQDVLKRWPEEACGVIINNDYYPCKNTASDPKESFTISGNEAFRLEHNVGKIGAILHSHPYTLAESKNFEKDQYDPRWPSYVDQENFLAGNIPWGIVATDGEGVTDIEWLDENEIRPIDGRAFCWFTADCLTLIRDWHRINTKIMIPNFPRKWGFWKDGTNPIEENLKKIPNAKIYPTEEAQVGDVAVFDTFHIGCTNHLGVITGSNEMLHQWVKRFPESARWDQWKAQCKYVVRLTKDHND